MTFSKFFCTPMFLLVSVGTSKKCDVATFKYTHNIVIVVLVCYILYV